MKTEVPGDKPVPLSLCQPQTPRGTAVGVNPDRRNGTPAPNRLSRVSALERSLN